MKRVLPVIIASTLAAFAQTPAFEVASVKLAAPDTGAEMLSRIGGETEEQGRFRGGLGTGNPGRIDYRGVTLRMLLKRAYGLQASQISGPGWLDEDRYDVAATVPPGTTQEQLPSMLQALLVERFEIRQHRETKRSAIYSLTVAKNGPKLRAPEPERQYKDDEERKAAALKNVKELLDARIAMIGKGGPRNSRHEARSTMVNLALWLSTQVGRPVVDKTQLDGAYSFTLEWQPEGAPVAGDGMRPPSIFAALEEQLGLKLQSENSEIELLVIDAAERVPAAN